MRAAGVAVAAVLCLPWSAASAVEEGLSVVSAQVKFGRKSASLRASTVLRSDELVEAFDPSTDPLEIRFGNVPIVSLPDAAARVSSRVDGRGYTRVRVRRPFGGRGAVDLRILPGSGWVDVRARGLDLEAVRAAGPLGVSMSIRLGGAEAATAIDFSERGRRRWEFLLALPGPVPPGGGSGGGGIPPGLPPPPPDTTPLRITILSQGQGSLYPASASSVGWVVCRSPSELAAMWAKHAPGTQPPTVDFAVEVVVGWFGGNPSLWHTVYASWAERLNGGIQVHMYMHGNQGVTAPGTHSIFRLTRSDGPIVPKAHWSIVGTSGP